MLPRKQPIAVLSLRLLRLLLLLHLFLFLLTLLSLILIILLWVVGGRDLEDGINELVEVRLLMADTQVEILVDLVKGLRIDAFGEVGVLLGPVLEDSPEARTDPACLLHQIVAFLI